MKVFQDEQMAKASTVLSNDHSHDDSDDKVVLSLSSKQRTNGDNEKTKSRAGALEEREIEPVPFDSVFIHPPSLFGCDDTNQTWSFRDYSFDSFDSKKAG